MIDEERKHLIKWIRESRSLRIYLQGLTYMMLGFYLITPKGLAFLSDSEERRVIFNKRFRTGLLEDSIIQNPLHFPDESDLSYEEAMVGRWISYDFNRRKELGEKRQLSKGKIYAFPLDRVLGNDVNNYTLIEDFDPFNVEDLMHFDTPPLDELSRAEFVIPTDYSDAFKKVGIYEDHAKQLDDLGISDKKVYQVTSKGNGLIFLDGDTGEKKPEEKSSPFTIGHQPIPIPVKR